MKTYYKVCNLAGCSKFDTLEEIDAYLTHAMSNGICVFPIKRIVKVTSEDVPLTETVRRYNDWATEKVKGAAHA